MTINRRIVLIAASFAAVMALMVVAILTSTHGGRDLQMEAWCEPTQGYACICNDGGRVWIASDQPIRNVCIWENMP